MTKSCGIFLIVALALFSGCGGGGGGATGNNNGGVDTLVSINITPVYPSIEKNGSQQFTATGTYSSSSVRDITGSVTWTSADAVNAPVNAQGMASGSTGGAYVITASLSGVSGTTNLTVNGLTGVPHATGQPSFSVGTVAAGNPFNVTIPVTPDTSMAYISIYDENTNLLTSKLITSLIGMSSVTVPITISTIVPAGSLNMEFELDGSTAGYFSQYLATSPTATSYSIYQENIVSGTSYSYLGQTGIPAPHLTVQNSTPNASLYYLETFPNGSGSSADTVLEVYQDPSATAIITNDEKSATSSYSQLRLYLVSGTTYYIKVRGFANDPLSAGPYSIRVSNSGFGGSSTGTPGDPDTYEADDAWGSATILNLGVVQDHTLSVIGSGPLAYCETDWFKFTAP